jgi:hypothetical protein
VIVPGYHFQAGRAAIHRIVLALKFQNRKLLCIMTHLEIEIKTEMRSIRTIAPLF